MSSNTRLELESPLSPQSPPTIRGHQGNLSINMNPNAQIPRTALSPVGSEWSVSKYSSPDRDLMFGGPPSSQNRSNSSPPSSIARSSDSNGLYNSNEGTATLKNIALEEQVAVHHLALSQWLREFLETKGNLRPNRARDKLLRLSVIQFQELSTDVYDELQRREPGMIPSDQPPPIGDTPPFLPPKQDFHPKRNQARQKLSTLPADRFRDLATDVFYELERRFPRFSSGLLPSFGSPTNSMDGRGIPPPVRVGSPGMPPRMGSPGMGPGRRGSPAPGMMGRGGYGPQGQNGYRGPPPRGLPPGGPPGQQRMGPDGNPNSFGRPLPKTYQSNTIIPNKSTMVEDDDDGDDDDDLDAFGLEDRRANGQRRNTGQSARSAAGAAIAHEADRKLIADYQGKVEILQDKVVGLEASLVENEGKLRALQGAGQQRDNNKQHEWEDLRINLEGKLVDAESLSDNLRSEIDRLKEESAATQRALQQQLMEAQDELSRQRTELEQLRNRPQQGQASGGAGNVEYQNLLREHDDLKLDLREQEEVTEEVRREAMEFLNQMKVISERADNSFEREERLSDQIQKLEADILEWKGRYAKAKTTIRSIRASSLGLQVPTSGGLFGKEGNLVDSKGLVKAVNLTKFQISIDELLKVARGLNFSQSLEQVKAVVIATRALTQDIDGDQGEAVSRLRSRISATANNLTTAAKNHATGCGLSPVSLLDAAASHLTATVIELVKLVKIRPTLEGEPDVEEEEEEYFAHSATATAIDEEPMSFSPDSSNGQFQPYQPHGNGNGRLPEINGVHRPISNDSMYSPVGSPRDSSVRGAPRARDGSAILGDAVGVESKSWGRGSGRGPSFGNQTGGSDVEELRLFLENQTNDIVESIQSLLESIKSDETARQLSAHITAIGTVVGKVLASTESAMMQTGNALLRERGEWIVANLGGCREKMIGMMEGIAEKGGDEKVGKEFKSKLAGLAFDMARETKELVRTVEDIDNEARRMMGGM